MTREEELAMAKACRRDMHWRLFGVLYFVALAAWFAQNQDPFFVVCMMLLAMGAAASACFHRAAAQLYAMTNEDFERERKAGRW